ncbi:unnamed protein product [Adineta ricciae]|uniref:Uncharacterized protein n=1 Tax=Adineta ricciae TaxID=249248 RepID=A0A813T0Y3_ADIRI|nr:unnamed protein product [Adineta ricciae]CAF1324633.1 unnamed protein product [Adineta ricciae]
MARCVTLLLFFVFTLSAIAHLFLQYKNTQCGKTRGQTSYLSWFTASWPYVAAYTVIKYVIPHVLTLLSLGPVGIIPRSITTWIQSMYGLSCMFSILQLIVARDGVSNPATQSAMVGQEFQVFKIFFRTDDHITQCVKYYEGLLACLNVFDLTVIVVFFCYWLLR